MGFPRQGFFSLLAIFLGVFFDSVSRCDGQSSVIGANSFKSLFACEDHIMHLSCPHRSLSVKIVSAKYGRLLYKKNICPQSSDRQVIDDCGENNVKPNVEKLCFGKTECSFNVDNQNLGAYCANVYKYISVIFKCVIKPTNYLPPTTKRMPTTKPTTFPPTFTESAKLRTSEPLINKPIPKTKPILDTTIPSNLTQTTEPSNNLSSANFTSGSSSNNTSEIDSSNEPIEATQKAVKVSPRTRKPVIEVYERDVFSRRNGATSTLSSGLLYNISKFAVSLLVLCVFDAYIFRVT